MIAPNVQKDGAPVAIRRPSPTPALLDALRSETRLLVSLLDVLRNQRTGVAQDDLQMVDESVYGAQRILLTLAEARRRRRSLLQIVAGDQDADLDDLESALGPLLNDEIRSARDELSAAARRVAAELEINRRVLKSAIRNGETYVKALYGVSDEPGVYAPAAEPQSGQPGSGLLLDKQV